MQKQNPTLIVIICILIISIGYVNFSKYNPFIKNKDEAKNHTGTVKSAIDVNSQTLEGIVINRPPQKINNFKESNIWADSYVLLDQDSFYPLSQKNMDKRVPIASTTKIMTAIIVLENYNLQDIVTISQNASVQIGSDTFLGAGEKITVNDLLYCLLIKSGNDSAMALAEHLTGNYEDFVEKMNEKSKYLGLKNTEFKDPAGLNDSGYSTPHELAIIASYAMKNKIFKEIVRTNEITIISNDGIAHKLDNSNRLIKFDENLYYPEALGIKTGFTPEAGHCLVAAAQKNNHLLISVILKTYEDTVEASAKESKKLLEWGFDNYQWD